MKEEEINKDQRGEEEDDITSCVIVSEAKAKIESTAE